MQMLNWTWKGKPRVKPRENYVHVCVYVYLFVACAYIINVHDIETRKHRKTPSRGLRTKRSTQCFALRFFFSFYFFLFHPRDYYITCTTILRLHLVIHLTIYASLEEHMPSDVYSINYSTLRYISLEVVFFLIGVLFRLLL